MAVCRKWVSRTRPNRMGTLVEWEFRRVPLSAPGDRSEPMRLALVSSAPSVADNRTRDVT